MNRDSEGRPIRLGDLVRTEFGVIVALGPTTSWSGLRLEFFYMPYSRTERIRAITPSMFGKRVIAR